MKTRLNIITLMIAAATLISSCNSTDDLDPMKDDDLVNIDDPTDDGPQGGELEMVEVTVSLPEGLSVDLESSKMVSLGKESDIESNGKGTLPLNNGTIEIGYLLNADGRVIFAGFISEKRKELSVATTAEVILYYAPGYYLLPENAKSAYLQDVQTAPGFNDFVKNIQTLFVNDALMYNDGSYETVLQDYVEKLTSKKSIGFENRIFFNDEKTKSGVTLSSVDSTNIKLQNSLPRRSRVLIYKKSYTDRNGEVFEIPNYSSSTFANFELEPGSNVIQELKVGSSLGEINAQQASIDNVSDSGAILIPVNPASELVAEYEVVVIGSGQIKEGERNMTDEERKIYADINKKTYVLDYFLPTLLDIGGNKSLLPPFGNEKENALFNAVSPVLEQFPDVVEEIIANDFKEATNILLPALYEDIRISNALRNILRDIYKILSGNGEFPNTFIQSQELIETGYDRTKLIMAAIDKNIKTTNSYANFNKLRTTAFNFESWDVSSIDAVVEMQRKNVELCLGQATELRVSSVTAFDPEVEDFEYHWTTSNDFSGRVQDIANNPNNFGQSIITTSNYVSYISTALESELGNGDNSEIVTVVLYFRNKNTGELSEAGRDSMTVDNKKGCVSFTASFVRQPNFRLISDSSLICSNGPEYQAFSPIPYAADFAKVDGATGYKGIITRSNGIVNEETVLDNELLEDIGDGILRYRTYVGSIRIYNSCNQAQAEARAEEWANTINVEPVSIEITPIFD